MKDYPKTSRSSFLAGSLKIDNINGIFRPTMSFLTANYCYCSRRAINTSDFVYFRFWRILVGFWIIIIDGHGIFHLPLSLKSGCHSNFLFQNSSSHPDFKYFFKTSLAHGISKTISINCALSTTALKSGKTMFLLLVR